MSAEDVFCGNCGSPKLETATTSSTADASSGLHSPLVGPGHVEAAQATETKNKRNFLLAVGAVLVLIVGFLVSKGSTPTTHDITYSLSVYDDSGCDLGWGYYNVLGMDITLKVDGQLEALESLPNSGYVGSLNSCVFETTFYGVEEGHSNYEFNSPRGDFSYSEAEMVGNNWSLDLSLGLD
jgi:hypothetical protein